MGPWRVSAERQWAVGASSELPMSTVPLRYRLPNPPSDFVGRDSELAALSDGLRDSPVTVVVGPGGVGKTALVLTTVHRNFPERVPRTLYLTIPQDSDALEARQEILRALALSTRTEIGWSHLQDDPEALTEAILDLAEAEPFWVIVDDLHHVPIAEGNELLSQLARYARTSRYVFTSRRAARATPGRVLEVGGLDPASALELASHVAEGRSPEALADAVRTSGGSPWLLREALLGASAPESSPSSEEPALLAGLTETARRFARLAALLELPIPAEDLAQATGIAEARWRPELDARGWLEISPAGVRLHEVAQQGITRGGQAREPSELWLPMARKLSKHATTAVRLEAVRLLVEGGAWDGVEEVLEEDLGGILADGYAPRLWKLLARAPGDRLQGARLRCAAELGSPTVLRQLPRPLGDSHRDRLTWAETRYMKGDIAGALDALDALAEEDESSSSTAPEEELRIDAELLRCRILIAQDLRAEAETRLVALAPTTEEESTRRDAIAASIAEVSPANREEALAELDALERRCTALGGRERAMARFHVAVAYLRLDAPDAAEAALGSPVSADAVDTLALFETRRAAWLHALLDITRGRLDAAQKRLDLLEPFLHSPSLIRSDVYLTRARLWMARGEFADLPALLDQARSEALTLGLHATLRRADDLKSRLSALLSGSEATLAPEELERRLGETERALAYSTAHGLWAQAAEERSLHCSLLLALGREVPFEQSLNTLRGAARYMGSLRFSAEVDLLQTARQADLARLEAIAAHPELSPVAARRARSLLSGAPAEDALDRAVLSCISLPSLELIVPAEDARSAWQPGWGIELSTRRAWLPTGEWLDLSRRALHLRLLLALARHGGSATKEELVHEVWEEREYHPLRHDTRLQVTVHKLRELLEDQPKTPRRLITTAVGYALAGPFRLAGRE